MRRVFGSARVAFFLVAAATPVLIASNGAAVAQFLDPGWQIVYSGQSGPGGAGLIDSVFSDGQGMAVPRVYQPAPPMPMYYQPMAAPRPRAYQAAPVYYPQVQAPQPRGYQSAQIYYQGVAPRQPAAYQPAPVYYQQVPPQRAAAYQPAPVYYQQAAPRQAAAYEPAPVYYQQAAPRQGAAYQPAPVYYQQLPVQQQAAAHQSAPAYLPRQAPVQVRAAQSPGSYQQASAQQPSSDQSGPQYVSSIPAKQAPAEQTSQPAAKPRGLLLQARAPQPAGAPASPQRVAQSSWHSYEQQPVEPGWHAYQQEPAPQPRGFFQSGWSAPPPVGYNAPPPGYAPSQYGDMAHPMVDPKYDRQVVDYRTNEPPGTIIVDTPHYFLYLVMEGGKALRYGIGVGREGFTWSGENQITAMREWPEWRPPNEMLERRPDLPRFVAGGPDNPLGARALYLGSTLYRIHGSNEPWTIGTNVSSGCIRLRNADIIDLYQRVKVGNKVVVL